MDESAHRQGEPVSAKRRRSKRVSKSERVMLNIVTPSPVQDIVVTLEVSAHGAKVLARRHLEVDSRGTATFIAVGRQVPCRVAWQRPPGPEGRMETGLEIYSQTNFWGLDLEGSEIEPAPIAPPPPRVSKENVETIGELVETMKASASPTLSIDLWCVLVDTLETKGVFSRTELIAMLKKLAKE